MSQWPAVKTTSTTKLAITTAGWTRLRSSGVFFETVSDEESWARGVESTSEDETKEDASEGSGGKDTCDIVSRDLTIALVCYRSDHTR